MIFSSIASKTFGRVVEKFDKQLYFLQNYLMKADIKVPLRAYLSSFLFYSLIGFFVAAFITLYLIRLFQQPFLFQILEMVFIPSITFTIIFLVGIFYPIEKTIRRRKDIETNLPFVLTHMGAIAQSGVPPQHLFKIVSKFEEYGVVSQEFSKIVRNIEVFGQDPLTAIREVAERTASDKLREILLGFISTIQAGGNLKQYIRVLSDQTLFEWRIKRQKFINQLSTYAEFYTGILIAAPLIIVALFSILAMFQPTLAGFEIITLTKLSTYLLVPLINIGFLVFLSMVEVEI